MALAVSGGIAAALERWTGLLYDEFRAVHHWDLPFRQTVYRVYLLPNWLEIDIAFTPEPEFGPRGPTWETVFGEAATPQVASSTDVDNLAGLCWHHVLHAAACIDRAKPWQAEWLIGQARHHTLAMACRRLGLPTAYARGTHLLPLDVTRPVEETLVAGLSHVELRRALAATADAVIRELEVSDPALAVRLRPMFERLTSY